MLAFLLAFVGPALQSPLNAYQPGALPGYGLVSAISRDGRELLQARGPELTRFDLAALSEAARTGDPAFVLDQALLGSVPLDTPILAMVGLAESGVLVAGGDGGLLLVDGEDSVLQLDGAGDARWCTDLAVDPSGTRLAALFSAWEDSELRVYDLSQLPAALPLLGAAPLRSRAAGGSLRFPASAFACRWSPDALFVAMGGSGLVRVAVAPDGSLGPARQGPVFHPEGRSARAERARFRARDLEVAGDLLFVAAEEAGLVELALADLGAFGVESPYRRVGTTPGTELHPAKPGFLSGPGYKDHVVRVEAQLEATADRILVAVGTLPTPSARVEWGPYRPNGGFAWDLTTPNVALDPTMVGKRPKLQLYERPVGEGDLALAQSFGITGRPAVWASLAMSRDEAGRYWFFDSSMIGQWTQRDAAGVWSPLVETRKPVFAARRPLFTLYTTGVFSKLDPRVFLPAVDGWESLPSLRLTGTYPHLRMEPLPGTESTKVPIFLQDTWVDSEVRPAEEWFVAGNDSPWYVYRLRSPSEAPKAPPFQVDSWAIPFDVPGGEACGWGGGTGRSYAAAASDPRPGADVVALSRSWVELGLSLYSRRAIMAAARAAEAAEPARETLGDWGDAAPKYLDTSPEVECSFAGSLAFRSKYFAWEAGAEAVLGLAAGSMLDPDSPDFQHAKVVLFRMGDCADLEAPCSASATPSGANTTVLVGATPQALAFAFEVASVPVSATESRQFAFVADTDGNVTAFDLEDAFAAGPGARYTRLGEVARWTVPAATHDGLRAPLTDLVARLESPADGEPAALHLYVAANRYGVVRLRVTPRTGPGAPLSIEQVERLNTPMQASGLSLAADPESGEPFLAVCDHDGTGVRLYTAR